MGGFLFLNKETMRPPYGKGWYRSNSVLDIMRMQSPRETPDSKLAPAALLLLVVAVVTGATLYG